MTIVRTCKETNSYVRADKRYLNDERLSWKAKGLLTYLLSKPDDWKLIVADLIKKASDGKDSVASGIRDLQNLKYLLRIPRKSPTGRFDDWEDVVFEEPQEEFTSHTFGPDQNEQDAEKPDAEKPDAEKPDAEKPDAEKPPLLTKERLTNEITNKLHTKNPERENENDFQNDQEAEEKPSTSLTSDNSIPLLRIPIYPAEQFCAATNQKKLNKFVSSAAKCDARFNRAYPWRTCNVKLLREFCEWKGRKFGAPLKAGMTPFEAGRGYVFNCEKTELDLQKLFYDWQDFQEYLTNRANAKTPIPGPRTIQEPPPDRSWLKQKIEQAKKEGQPYARTHA